VPGTREVIQAALRRNLVDEDGKPAEIRLLPALSAQQIDEFARSCASPPPDDVRDLLGFCSGIDGTLEQLDFTGRSMADGFGLDFLTPHGIPIAHDGYGNFWVVDVHAGAAGWGPIYFCCHDAPVILLQAATVEQFVTEVFRMHTPPHASLIDDVHEDRLFRVWRTNPGVMTHAEALSSPDADLRAFAGELDPAFELIDLRGAPIGMGFSWGRYGPQTDVRRFGALPILAYRRPEKKPGILSRLFGR
jgi:hypothetical protein